MSTPLLHLLDVVRNRREGRLRAHGPGMGVCDSDDVRCYELVSLPLQCARMVLEW
jgi:hypothetical protein